MGISSALEVYQQAIEQLLSGYPCHVITDDLLIWGATKQGHDSNLKKVLDRLREIKLILAPHKTKYKVQEVPTLDMFCPRMVSSQIQVK